MSNKSGQHWARRLRDPYTQNVIAGICVAFSAGVFTSLNLLGAGGGQPASAQVVQTANAILSSVWFFSACFGGTILNKLGPGPTLSAGVCTYAFYVVGLWYLQETGCQAFPLFAGAVIGVGAGMVFVTSGYISVSYSDEKSKGRYIAAQNNLQAIGSITCGILPVILNKDNTARAGVPRAFYAVLLAIMCCVACLALLLKRPDKLRRADGSVVAVDKPRTTRAELAANMAALKDWRFIIMLPAFLPAGSFLIYNGSVNAFQNDLRARSLCSFIAVVAQIPCGYLVQRILDHPRWSRKSRGLAGLTFVAVPLLAAWFIETLRVSRYDRSTPPQLPLDWTNAEFGWVMVMFVIIWVFSVLWQYIVPYFIGALTNSPVKLSHYMGVWRGILAAGEAICFGLDAIKIPYVKFAGGILVVYTVGVAVLYWVGLKHIQESCYHQEGEEGVIVPGYIHGKHEAWYGNE